MILRLGLIQKDLPKNYRLFSLKLYLFKTFNFSIFCQIVNETDSFFTINLIVFNLLPKYTDIVGFIVLSHCNEITFLKEVFNKKDIHEKVLYNDYQELKIF